MEILILILKSEKTDSKQLLNRFLEQKEQQIEAMNQATELHNAVCEKITFFFVHITILNNFFQLVDETKRRI